MANCSIAADTIFLVTILCLFSFLLSALAFWYIGNFIIKNYLSSFETVSSKMLSVLPEQSEGSLIGYTENLITELEIARQRERLIADYSSELLCSLNADRKIMEVNFQGESLLGYSSLALTGTPLESLALEEDRPALSAYFEACKQGIESSVIASRYLTGANTLIDLELQCEWSNSMQRYFCLAKDITDRMEKERLKSEFSAMITHDLRAPVAGLRFLMENLQSGTYGELPRRANDEIETAYQSVERLLSLINQLLDAEKLESGKMEAEIKIIPLSEVYDYAGTLLAPIAASKNISMEFPQSEQLVFADFDQISQVLCNIISNAIKWSPENSSVLIYEKVTGRSITLSVVDRGPGISEQRKQMIFQRFKSLERASAKDLPGSGLGLYIAKKLVELLGGSIGVNSSPGKGSTFWFTLNLAEEKDLPGFE